jgi:hypothetical protein
MKQLIIYNPADEDKVKLERCPTDMAPCGTYYFMEDKEYQDLGLKLASHQAEERIKQLEEVNFNQSRRIYELVKKYESETEDDCE